MQREPFTNYTSPLSLLLTMGSAIVVGSAVSVLSHGFVVVREVQDALVAGVVVGGSASYVITNPLFSVICGFTAAVLQPLFELVVEKPLSKRLGLISTYSTIPFAFQSIVGGILMSILTIRTRMTVNDGFAFSSETSSGEIFSMTFISAGIGLGTGLIIGLVAWVTRPRNMDLELNDREFWAENDYISVGKRKKRKGKGGRELAPEVVDMRKR